jgi:LCP family protein required for cell wall assembly
MKIRTVALPIMVLILILGACVPSQNPKSQELPSATFAPTPAIMATASQTPSPSLTPTETATATATPWIFPTAQFTDSSLPMPDRVADADPAFAEDVKVYVLLGSDYAPWRTKLSGGTDNTDAFIVIVIRKDNPGISIISIPRDLYVFQPGWGMSRINTAYRHGGPQMVADTLRYNFGLPMDGIAYVRMQAFSDFIDGAFGGLDVGVTEAVYDHCSDIYLNYLPGTYHMDGKKVLCYARARMNSGDFSRDQRQRDVLFALRNAFVAKAGSDPAGLLGQIIQTYSNEQRFTDVSIPDMLAMLPTVLAAKDNIEQFQLGYDVGLVHWTHPVSDAWLLLPPSSQCMNQLMDWAVLGEPWATKIDVLKAAGCPIQ